MKSFERVTDAFRAHGLTVRETGPGRAQAQAPGHSGEDLSASFRHNGHDRTLFNCFSDDKADVLDALGLTTADLFDSPRGAEYVYPDGRIVTRTPGKRFGQRENTTGTSLYRVQQVKDAIARGETVYVVEGENDVHAVELVGGAATCSAMGAGKAKRFDWSPLAGGDVVVVADKDEPGRKHAAMVRDILMNGVGVKSLRVVEAKTGKDAADHIAAEHGLGEFAPLELLEEAKRPSRRPMVTWADQIPPEPVVWAWGEGADGRLPAGALCVAAGREGTGKSSFGIWLAAQITRGELEGAWSGHARKVLYVAAEDSWKHTLVPRLIAAGADLSRVGQFKVVVLEDEEIPLSLPVDNDLLERTILAEDVGLVVLDPLMSVISERVDTHRERDVRTALDPLAKIADRTGAVILGIAHFNKSASSDPASLITGSGAFKNVPRAVLGFAKDPESGERVMTQAKNSLGRDDLPSLGYSIAPVSITTKKGEAMTCRLEFTGESERSVSDILRAGSNPEDVEDSNAARAFIKDYLLDPERGGEALVADVLKAGRTAGFGVDALKNARSRSKSPKIKSQKASFGGGWAWIIADDAPEGVTKVSKVSALGKATPSTPSATPSPGTPTVADPPTATAKARACPECGELVTGSTEMHVGCVLKRSRASADRPGADTTTPDSPDPATCLVCPKELVHPISKAQGLCTIHYPITDQAMADYYKAKHEETSRVAS